MDEATFLATREAMVSVGRLIVSTPLDLDGFIAAIDHAETVGPILDPTLYIAAGDEMRKQRHVAEALRACRAKLEELR